MVRDARKCPIPEVCCNRCTSRWCVIGIPQLDRLVGSARQKLLISSPHHALDNVVMRIGLPDLTSVCQVPDFDHTVSATARESLKRIAILRHRINTIDMTPSKIADKWIGEHALQLDSIQGSDILAAAFERMSFWLKILLGPGNGRAGRLVRRGTPRECFDFLAEGQHLYFLPNEMRIPSWQSGL